MGSTKLSCIGLAAGETGRGAAAGEEPHLDGIVLPFGDVVATVDSIEAGAVGVGIGSADTAASSARGAIDCAIVEVLGTKLSPTIGRALGVGMEHHAVDFVIVDTFQNIDLPLRGPGLPAESPEGRPGTANTTGHVLHIKHEETPVVLLLALKTDTVATRAGCAVQPGLGVDTKDSIAIVILDVAPRLSPCAVDIAVRRQSSSLAILV